MITTEKETPEMRQRIEDFSKHATSRANQVFKDTIDLIDNDAEAMAVVLNVLTTMVMMAAEYATTTGFTRDQTQFFRAYARYVHEMEPHERKSSDA